MTKDSHHVSCASWTLQGPCDCWPDMDDEFGYEETPDVAPDYGLPPLAYLGKG